MSVLASYEKLGSTDLCYIAAVKGAPETLHSMFSQCPPDYHHIHTEISREGARVLALGYKELGHLTHQQVTTACHTQPSQHLLPLLWDVLGISSGKAGGVPDPTILLVVRGLRGSIPVHC